MHILVIGGAGYIGSHVVKELLDRDIQVSVYDDLSTGQEINLFEKANFIQASTLDFEALTKALSQNIDGVILLAGKKAVGESMENPAKYADTNITGSINVLNAMVQCGVKHIIFSSSASVYGNPQYIPVDEKHPLNPMSFYGFTKQETERFLFWYSQLKDIHYVALRYFNAVGYDVNGAIRGLEKNPQNLLPIVMETACGMRPSMSIFGTDYDTPDGTAIRDYIHVADLASAHYLSLAYLLKGGKSDVFNLGTGKGISVREMITKTQEIIGHPLQVKEAPKRAGDPSIVLASCEKAKEVLGWEAKQSDIETIIRSTWKLYQK